MTNNQHILLKQVKSRLLPLPKIGHILEFCIELLPRTQFNFEIIPSDLIVSHNEIFEAVGNNAYFEISFSPLTTGSWFYIEAALSRNNGNREAYIHPFISDDDKSEYEPIAIPTNLRGTIREVFYLPSKTKKLHWIPTTTSGFFSQSPLLIHKITYFESVFRRLYRVIFDWLRFNNKPQSSYSTLRSSFFNLQESYQQSASLRIHRQKNNDYSAFISKNDTLKPTDIKVMENLVSKMPLNPLITLIMPITPPLTEVYLLEALDSVTLQIYPHWELLITGDFSNEANIYNILAKYKSKHKQIRIIETAPNENLAHKLNRALKLSQGEFVAVVNQHDIIPIQTLYSAALEINNHPNSDLIYTDHDYLDDAGKRQNPHFKPDWNLDLLLSHNYLVSLAIYRRVFMLALGGYRSHYIGAELYDFSLRFIKIIQPQNIKHIPKVLYHIRKLSNPAAPYSDSILSDDELDNQIHQSGKLALQSYFEGTETKIEDGVALGLYHVRHPLPKKPPLVTIIITTRNKVNILSKCIESIQQKTKYSNWEILIVDNQSSEPETLLYFESIKQDDRINVIQYNKPFNFSALNNFAAKQAKGEVLALLNNDVEVITPNWLTEMVSHAIRPTIGAVGAKLLYKNGLVQHAGVITGLGGVAGHAHRYLRDSDSGYRNRAVITQNLSAVTGACLVVRKSCYFEVDGLNEQNLSVAFNDIDFCLKLRQAGYHNLFTPYAKLYHYESISRGADDTPEKHTRFTKEFEYMKKIWCKELQKDPAYNPNLTLEFEDFSINQTQLNSITYL